MGDDRKAQYEMAPTSDPENPEIPAKKAELETDDETSGEEWSGLGKEELLRVADTPGWNWTRNILLVLFWVAWIVMLVVAIILVVKAPSCPKVEWYEKSPIYQVFVPSFKDSNNDGVGDLIGLKDQVGKIKEDFGAESIVLSPIFKQANNSGSKPNVMGRDTVDFQDIDPLFGTVEDLKKLVAEVQENGMHIILEFVPNQSSEDHMWFVDSKASKDGKYADYYTWADPDGSGPPNDWVNYKGKSAWTYVEERGQYYYHFYESSQPDLNFQNQSLVQEIKNAMNYWLDELSIDGFILVDADRLVEDVITTSVGRRRRELGNNTDNTTMPMASGGNATVEPSTEPTEVASMGPTAANATEPTGMAEPTAEPTVDGGGSMPSSKNFGQYNIQSGSSVSDALVELMEDLYSVIESNSYLGKFRVFIPQHSGPMEQNLLFQKPEWHGFASSLQFANSLDENTTTYEILEELRKLQEQSDKLGNSWMLGHAGVNRFATRAGDKAKALMMVFFTLPGTPLPFYGDELGLQDSSGAYPQLAPYPWDNSTTGGFNANASVAPWVPYTDNIVNVNAMTQKKTEGSFYNYYNNLTVYHAKPSILAGAINVTSVSGELVAYKRAFPEWPEYLVVVNLGPNEVTDFTGLGTEEMKGTLVLSASGDGIGEEIKLDSVDIKVNDAYLIELMM